MVMFKIFEIQFYDHQVLKDLTVKLVGDNEEDSKNYLSLIIGPNGNGKTQILQAIVGIFNSLAELKSNPNKKFTFEFQFRITYSLNQIKTIVEYKEKKLAVNSSYSFDIESLPIPERVLISAFTFNDKFPLRESRGKLVNPGYYYLGLKSTTNNVFINNPSKDTIDNLCLAIKANKDIRNLSEGFKILGLKPEIKVIYRRGRHFNFLLENDFFENRNISFENFGKLFNDYLKKKKRKSKQASEETSKRYASEKYKLTLNSEERILETINYLNENIRNLIDAGKLYLNYVPKLNFLVDSTFLEFENHIIPFQTLRDLEIIGYSGFEVNKNETSYSFDNASSGEYHIISTLVNINAFIEQDSVVLIDEPEISLHPNWQMQFMRVFSRVFRQYETCHFIICSHSHFIVSDLNKESSHITSLNYNSNENKIQAIPINKDTMGWSPEAILYHVFGVVNVRNRYFENDLRTALNILSNKADKNQLKPIYDRLIRFKLPDADPLKIVINDIQAYLNETPIN
jgi:predicted ATPase